MWQMIKEAGKEWTEDKVPRLSAALAFYTMLSLAPLLIISLKIVTLVMRNKQGAQTQITNYISSISTPQTADTFNQIFQQQAQQPHTGTLATFVSLIILLLSASGVFGELQTSMNEVWELEPRPDRGFLATIKDRFFSMTLVLGTAFLLLVSLVISTVITTLSNKLMPGQNIVFQIINFIISLAIITVLFSLIFKYLPDAVVDWKYVWIGGVVTAVLFTAGKWALGIYLAKGTTASIFGAMGSLVALLIWVYYSSQIFFFGAELIQVYAARQGHPIRPDEKAMWIEAGAKAEAAREQKGQAEWYPAVPVRRELAVAESGRAAVGGNGNGGGAGPKLLILAAGVAVGKLLLGGGNQGGKKLAVGRMVEPGFVTRRHRYENKEYVVRFRPPKLMTRAADSIRRGHEKTRNRIAEYIEG